MTADSASAITLFLGGDVMTGRGIDQILPHPSTPELFESWITDARDYVKLAEQQHGPLPRPVGFADVWGDALPELQKRAPQARIVNLETAITAGGSHWPDKGIHYRMHPGNLPCLTAAGIDCCALANNHVLDWGRAGLTETLANLHRAGIRGTGAGNDDDAAQAAAVLDLPGKSRLLVFAAGHSSSGIPSAWAATAERPGIHLLDDLSAHTLQRIAAQVRATRQDGDVVLYSIHWGDNWGYDIPASQRAFARALVDEAGVDLVHGHSSHHPKGIEVHRGKLILYGCGDLLNDYEGISGHEDYRPDLALLYFPVLDLASRQLQRLELVPMQMRGFRLRHASPGDTAWLAQRLNRECLPPARVAPQADGTLHLYAPAAANENRAK